MRSVFTTPEILAATGGTLIWKGAGDTFCGVSTDSRTTQTGELFIPLTGDRHDGHDFIPPALARGARGVLVEDRIFGRGGQGPTAPVLTKSSPKPSPPTSYRGLGGVFEGRTGEMPFFGPHLRISSDITVIAVNDALSALGDLAQAWRARFTVPVVAVTGSCGKTTTKEMIAAVLAPAFRVLKNHLNLNNLIGLPLTLLGLEGTHEVAVVEMGMNAFGEIGRLTKIAAPTLGVLTNVHPAHTEGVGDVAGVAQAKGELISSLNHGAALIYNADDPWVRRLAQDFQGPKLGFGLSASAQLQATDRRMQGRSGQEARLQYRGQTWPLALPAAGMHMLLNGLAATAVGLSLGLSPEETAAPLAQFRSIARRSQVTTLASGVNLLNDCYNANPGSMAMALHTLLELKNHGRAAAALGDMLELGEAAAGEHRELGRLAAAGGLDYLVTYGNHRLEVASGARENGLSAARIFPVTHLTDAARILQELLEPGDWLLVKGSRSMHLEGLVDLLEGSSS